MLGGAITLAEKFNKLDLIPGLILATDMLNLSSFLALTRKRTVNVPTSIYFHENQLTYPWSPIDRDVKNNRDHHFSFINYISAHIADKVFFNSAYHKDIFLKDLTRFLKQSPDNRGLKTVDTLRAKSEVLYLGVDLTEISLHEPEPVKNRKPLILWNHRWEHDKNPEDLINTLISLKNKNIDFNVAFLGECFNKVPDIFLKAKKHLKENIVHFGYVEDQAEYIDWLWRADIIPVTSHHDFFGASIVQAIHCGCIPLLPKRLSYPELVPVGKYPDNFYSGQEDLAAKLEDMILNPQNYPAPKEAVARFDWPNMISEYNEKLAAN